MDRIPAITIFTPAYNRAENLKRAYISLKRQTSKDFVWLIVDDGSTDDTADVVKEFQDEAVDHLVHHHGPFRALIAPAHAGVQFLCSHMK